MLAGATSSSRGTPQTTGPNNAYSSCSTARIKCKQTYLIDVLLKRTEFPDLRAAAIALAR
jgi:hypothetical protein